MPGISGLISTSPLQDARGALAKMQHVQSMPNVGFACRDFSDRHCALLSVANGLFAHSRRPGAENGTHVLFVEGEVFDVSGKPCASGQELASVLLDLYMRGPSRFAEQLNGEFNIVVYEPRAARLSVFSDHLSSRPMFYWHGRETLIFASEKKALLSVLPAAPTVDEIGLLQLFAHEHCIGDRTFISDVKRLGPGSCLRYEKGNVRVDSWHAFDFGPRASCSFEDAVDSAACQLQTATLKRCLPERRILLTLSGGLDSRAVAAAIPRHLRPLPSLTQSVSDAAEGDIARQVAERLGIEHHRADPLQTSLAELAPMVAWRTEGETTLRNALGAANHPTMKRLGDFMAGGWLAECTSGQIIAPFMLLPASRSDFVERCYRHKLRYPPEVLRRVFAPAFLARNTDALREDFIGSWRAIGGETNIDRYHGWYLANRAVRMTNSSMPVDSHLFEKIRPFYDRQYIEALAGFPWHYRLGQVFYKAVIHRLGPELRDIPESRSNQCLHPDWQRNALGMVGDWLGRAASRAQRAFRKATAYTAAASDAIDPGTMVRKAPGLRRAISDFANGPFCDTTVFNSGGIQALLKEHYDDGIDHSELILYLAVMHKALELLVSRKPQEPPEIQFGSNASGVVVPWQPYDRQERRLTKRRGSG